MKEDIARIRAQIDEIDSQLLGILQQRTKLAVEVVRMRGQAKQDVGREQEILERLTAINQSSELSPTAIIGIWQVILKESRQAQANYISPKER